MKAVIQKEYGSPDVLELKEVEKPIPKENEVLIQVQAASVNDWDWGLLRGKPFFNRIMYGLFTPKVRILGSDISGLVEAVGSKVTQFQPGDEVFGDLCENGFGSFCEYVCAPENALIQKPAGITFEEAAAMPQAGLLALQGLQYKGKIQKGHHVLINGAGGGAGSFAIQIAKSLGAIVTAVDSAAKFALMRQLGADHMIDYQTEDFTKNGQQYDRILDCSAHHSLLDYKRSLSPQGVYGAIGGGTNQIFQTLILGPWFSLVTSKKMGIVMYRPNQGLAHLTELVESGEIRPVVDRSYPLEEAAEAMRYFGAALAQGKLILSLEAKTKPETKKIL